MFDITHKIKERAAKVKSVKVKKYVKGGLLGKLKEAGDSGAYWLERLEYDFDKLKPEGWMKGLKRVILMICGMF